jgi:hypothetical protein
MPRWSNGPLTVYHGTDSDALASYGGLALYNPVPGFVIDVTCGRSNMDFGQGFYMTTYDHQARQWANIKVSRGRRASRPAPSRAVVLSFSIDRDLLAGADALAFVVATTDYWDLVHDCRLGFPTHGRPGTKKTYDIVYGPVSLSRQELTIHDSDQISLHDQVLANQVPSPIVYQMATAASGLF